MEASKQSDQYLQLFQSYPLIFLTQYTKSTNFNKCIQTNYGQMKVTLSSFVDIIIQFLLLIYQTSTKLQNLTLADNPSTQNGRKMHFYILRFKGQKRFAQINQLQISAEIIKFLRNLCRVKIIDGKEYSKQKDFKSIVEWFERYLEQNQLPKISTKISHHERNRQYLVDILTKVRTRNEIVKYSRILQRLNYSISNKIMLSPQLSYRHLEGGRGQLGYQGESEAEEWKRRVNNLHQFLLDLEESQVINSLKKDSETKNVQNGEGEKDFASNFVKFHFFVDIINIEGDYENEIPQLAKCCHKIKVLLTLDYRCPRKIEFKTNSLWILDKNHYFEMSQHWVNLKFQWLKLLNFSCITVRSMNVGQMTISFDQEKYFQLCEYHYLNDGPLKRQVTCILDKQILFHLMMFNSLEASHRQVNEILNSDDTIFTLPKKTQDIMFKLNIQVLKQWMLFMSKKFNRMQKISMGF